MSMISDSLSPPFFLSHHCLWGFSLAGWQSYVHVQAISRALKIDQEPLVKKILLKSPVKYRCTPSIRTIVRCPPENLTSRFLCCRDQKNLPFSSPPLNRSFYILACSMSDESRSTMKLHLWQIPSGMEIPAEKMRDKKRTLNLDNRHDKPWWPADYSRKELLLLSNLQKQMCLKDVTILSLRFSSVFVFPKQFGLLVRVL